MPAKEWRLAPYPPPGFAASIGFPGFQAHLLYNRGVRTREEAHAFLAADSSLEHDPFLIPDMEKAVDRLKKACSNGEVIGVYGDFDADGITGTAVLSLGLRELGVKVVPYIPHRVDEGHGLNVDAVDTLRSAGVSVVVTVDCGVTDVDEVASASSMGIDTIITDHHSPEAGLPDACAVVHAGVEGSQYPFRDLTGVGMAYKLVSALWESLGRGQPDHLLELVALGTVADVGRMEGENRFFVTQGLRLLNRSGNVGLRALMDSAGISSGAIDEETLSFSLIPRINAPGRLDRPTASLSLLTTSSRNEASQLAAELDYMNRERQELTRTRLAQAYDQVGFPDGIPPLVIVSHRDWEAGVIGLIAGQLSEQYFRPAIAITVGEEVSRGSARSIPELDIVSALRTQENLLLRFGGHPLAAGFSVKTSDLPALTKGLFDYASSRLDVGSLTPSIDIDCELAPSSIWGDNFQFIRELSPFGSGNPRPTFLTKSVGVAEARLVGGQGTHLKMSLYDEGSIHDAIAFRLGHRLPEADGRIDLVFRPSVDEWRGRKRLQLVVQDFAPSS